MRSSGQRTTSAPSRTVTNQKSPQIHWCPYLKAAYIIYVLIFFQTTYSIHHPLEAWIQNQSVGDFLRHPVSTGRYESKICPLGKAVAVGLAIWVIITGTVPRTSRLRFWNHVIWTTVMLCGLLMNLNFVVYLLPVYLLETVLHTGLL